MKIREGQFVKDFTVTDIENKEVKLSDFKGQKIILSFYRNVSCPFCNRRVHKLMGMNYKLKESGVQMLFFFESSNEKISSSVFHQGVNPWPVIGDPDKLVYKLYGVEQSVTKMMRTMVSSNMLKAQKDVADLNLPNDKDASKTLIPADIFIGEDFKVVKAHYGKHIDDHVDIDELKQFAGIDRAM